MRPASARTMAPTAASSSSAPAASAGRYCAAGSIASADGVCELSDEGSGAWIGREALRRVLAAHDGRIAWTGAAARRVRAAWRDPHAIVHWAAQASPRDFGTLAPVVVEHASRDDAAAVEILRLAATHVDAIATRLVELGVPRLSLTGGLAAHIEGLLPMTPAALASALGDALDGALLLARAAAAQSAAA